MKKLFALLLFTGFLFTAHAQTTHTTTIGAPKYKVVVKHTLQVDSFLIITKTITATLNFQATDSLSSRDTTIAFYGAAVGDAVLVSPGLAAINAKTSYSAWVSATNAVTVRFNNYSFATVNPSSASFKLKIIK